MRRVNAVFERFRREFPELYSNNSKSRQTSQTEFLHVIFGNRRKQTVRQIIDLLCDGDERQLYLLNNWTLYDYHFHLNEMIIRPPDKRKTVKRGERQQGNY